MMRRIIYGTAPFLQFRISGQPYFICMTVRRYVTSYLLVSCLFALASCGRCGWGTYYLRGIQSYSGDGTIRDVSRPSGLFGTRGYSIDFPRFDLGQRYEAQYHFTGLPALGGRATTEIALIIEDARGYLASEVDQLKETAKGRLKCSLVDSSSKVITQFDVPLKDLIWSSPVHDRSGYALYQLDKSFFTPNSKESYTLTVEYSGDATLTGKTGFVYVWCGCGGS